MEIIIPWQNQGAHGINNSYCSRAARGDVDQQSTPERQCARSAPCAGSFPGLGRTSGFVAATAPECG